MTDEDPHINIKKFKITMFHIPVLNYTMYDMYFFFKVSFEYQNVSPESVISSFAARVMVSLMDTDSAVLNPKMHPFVKLSGTNPMHP
jgi:hypothetical protein